MKKKHILAMTIICTMAAGCAEKAVETPEPQKEVVPAIELSNMDTTSTLRMTFSATPTTTG
jgi:hypothetical protein